MLKSGTHPIIVCIVLAAVLPAVLPVVAFNAEEDARKSPRGVAYFVRPLKFDRTFRDVLSDTGVDVFGFTYRFPKDTKVVITLVALNADGKLIPSLSEVHSFTPPKGKLNEGSFKLTRIDASQTVEGYRGKVRWLHEVSRNIGQQITWTKNRYTSTGRCKPWLYGEEINRPVPGKEYRLWGILSHPKLPGAITNDTPKSFQYEVRIRFVKMGAGDSYDDLQGRLPNETEIRQTRVE